MWLRSSFKKKKKNYSSGSIVTFSKRGNRPYHKNTRLKTPRKAAIDLTYSCV